MLNKTPHKSRQLQIKAPPQAPLFLQKELSMNTMFKLNLIAFAASVVLGDLVLMSFSLIGLVGHYFHNKTEAQEHSFIA